MKKDISSFRAGVSVVLLCALEYNMRMTGKGHVVFSLLDRPFSFVILVALAGISMWAHKTKRILVRNMAMAGFVFVIL